MKRNTVIVLVLVLVLVLGIAAVTILFLRANSSLGAAKAEVAAVTAELSNARAAITRGAAAAKVAASKLAESEAKADSAAGKLEAAGLDLAEARADLDELRHITSCPGSSPTIDFASNATVSEGLKAWVSEKSGSVKDATWDVIWGNSHSAIHKVRGEYLDVFVVTFDEPDLDSVPRIFDVARLCFLDL